MNLSFKSYFHEIFDLPSKITNFQIVKPTLHQELFTASFKYPIHITYKAINDIINTEDGKFRISKEQEPMLQKMFYTKIQPKLKTLFQREIPELNEVYVSQELNSSKVKIDLQGGLVISDPESIYNFYQKMIAKDNAYDSDLEKFTKWYAENVEEELLEKI